MCSLRSFAAKKRRESGIALVITLLMLSVITFLAIAFLSMTKRDRSAVTTTLDLDTARTMSDAALARAQTEIVARMMAQTDILSYDYMASHNFIKQAGFDKTEGTNDPNNVNYDYLTTGSYNAQTDPSDWAQNIGNLFYDPRPPVFVMTNGNLAQPSNDFRYWVDINRNGSFESNGYVQMLNNSGQFFNPSVTNFYNGEPEWIGVLKYPGTNHSWSNQFIGRYAYMVLPIGKTLDWNFIHNYSQNQSGSISPGTLDCFSRDEGVGSWELNLAALLNDISSTMYPPGIGSYQYLPNGANNLGTSFNDAVQFICYRYTGYNGVYPQPMTAVYNPLPNGINYIDEYGKFPSLSAPLDYNQYSITSPNPTGKPWPGSYNTNLFYDVQDLFDPNKTGTNNANGTIFANRFASVMTNLDSYDRYTFQRLLACIGTSSSPEYGVYVYSNGTTNLPGTPRTWLRTKVNINYDNTAQIQAGPYDQYGHYTAMTTNLVPWDPLTFFTNAADLLLSSQEFPFTNFTTNGPVINYNHFGINGIPIYNSTNASIGYNAKIHRMLQLAANIYDSSCGTNYFPPVSGQTVYFPHTFRPLFSATNTNGAFIVNIVGYTNVIPNDPAFLSISTIPFYDLSDSNHIQAAVAANQAFNIWGVPWIVGTVKGLPSFNKYTYVNRINAQRELLFVRGASGGRAITNQPPLYTNQFYVFTISNLFGMDAWNPYASDYRLPYYVYASNYVTIQITNNYNNAYTNGFSFVTNGTFSSWPGWPGGTSTSGFLQLLLTNTISMPTLYYSDITHTFNPWSNTLGFSNAYAGGSSLPPDFTQSGSPSNNLPVHTWTFSVTNHVVYYMYDKATGRLLDFVNLGPFISTNTFIPATFTGPSGQNPWLTNGANDVSGLSAGVQLQINAGYTNTPQLYGSLNPAKGLACFPDNVYIFGPGYNPSNMFDQTETWVANDPLVHYTVDDLTWPGYTDSTPIPLVLNHLRFPLTNSVGTVSKRYTPWPATGTSFAANMLFTDPLITNADAWQFPTNLLPGVGWLGRVHRGTPWQTMYLKADNPTGVQNPAPIAAWATWVNSPEPLPTTYTYPTNDWPLIDLFTAVPNDNAARGLLSVNQTNDAAWAAVFAGAIALTDPVTGVAINPTNDLTDPLTGIMEANNGTIANGVYTNGINVVRAYQTNGIFHHIGDILQAPALTTQSPFLTNYIASGGTPTDEMVERIPQQTLSLLKLGLPQFVIYSWGQSLKPKNLYSGSGNLNNICTNYEITGEFLSRTVCHILGDPTAAAPKIVIDNYNIEPGN